MTASRPQWSTLATWVVVSVVVLFLIVQARQTIQGAERRLRIVIEAEQEPNVISVVEAVPGGPAAASGLRADDRIVAIFGQPVTTYGEFDQALSAGMAAGDTVPFTIERNGVQRVVEVDPGVSFPWWGYGSNALLAIAYCALALFVLADRTDDVRRLLVVGFAFAAALEFALWPTELAALTFTYRLAIGGLYYLLVGAQIGFLLHLAAVTPQPRPWLQGAPRRAAVFYVVGGVVGIVLTVGAVTALLGVQPFPWSSGAAERAFFMYGLPVWAAVVIGLVGAQVRSAESHKQRLQAQLVFLGVLPWTVFVVGGTVAQLAGHPFSPLVYSLQPIVLVAFPVAVFIAIFRYQLFDIELVIRRGLIYGTMTVALVALFYTALVVGGLLFADLFETGYSIWFVSAVTLALGIAFTPLRRFLQGWIDRRFFPERYALRKSLIALAAELPSVGTLPRMGTLLIDRVREVFGCDSAAVLLAEPKANLLVTLAAVGADSGADDGPTLLLSRDDPGLLYLQRLGRPLTAEALAERSGPSLQQRLRLEDVELVVPIVQSNLLVGVILLGSKTDGGRFVSEEQELLSLLAHHVATVFENARLFESATYDPLTGLLRREAILERLEEEVQRAIRYDRPLSIGMADLDHFKTVNDEHGHLAGDMVLQRIAQAVRSTLRGADAVGRYGGEELLFVLPETPLEDAMQVAEKVRQRVAASRVVVGDGDREVRVTVSIGVASLELLSGSQKDARSVIAAADERLLRAKRNGRDRVVAVA